MEIDVSNSNRYYKLALKTAETSEHKKQQMAAVVVRGGAILSLAPNLPTSIVGREGISKHAEERAILQHYDYTGATIYVARKGGSMSKPCGRCQKLLQEKGFSFVVYANWNGELVKEKVKDLVAENSYFVCNGT